MKQSDSEVLQKIISYCEDIEALLNEYQDDFSAFENKIAFQYSCNMCIIQIGELVSRLSDEFMEQHTEIPWHAVKAMRNLHAHDYERVNLNIVWNTLHQNIPDLKEKISKWII